MAEDNDATEKAAEAPVRAIEAWQSERCAGLSGAALANERAQFAAARHLNQWAEERMLSKADLDAGFARLASLRFG